MQWKPSPPRRGGQRDFQGSFSGACYEYIELTLLLEDHFSPVLTGELVGLKLYIWLSVCLQG